MMMKLHCCLLRYKNKDCDHRIRCFGTQTETDLCMTKSHGVNIFSRSEINPISDRKNLEMKWHLPIVRSRKQRSSYMEIVGSSHAPLKMKHAPFAKSKISLLPHGLHSIPILFHLLFLSVCKDPYNP